MTHTHSYETRVCPFSMCTVSLNMFYYVKYCVSRTDTDERTGLKHYAVITLEAVPISTSNMYVS